MRKALLLERRYLGKETYISKLADVLGLREKHRTSPPRVGSTLDRIHWQNKAVARERGLLGGDLASVSRTKSRAKWLYWTLVVLGLNGTCVGW